MPASPPEELGEEIDLRGRDIVGGAVTLRGTRWGVVVLRCERSVAERLVASARSDALESGMRALVCDVARAVAERLDPSALIGEPVALDTANAQWRPTSARLQARYVFGGRDGILVVEIRRRTRSEQVAAILDLGPSCSSGASDETQQESTTRDVESGNEG